MRTNKVEEACPQTPTPHTWVGTSHLNQCILRDMHAKRFMTTKKGCHDWSRVNMRGAELDGGVIEASTAGEPVSVTMLHRALPSLGQVVTTRLVDGAQSPEALLCDPSDPAPATTRPEEDDPTSDNVRTWDMSDYATALCVITGGPGLLRGALPW